MSAAALASAPATLAWIASLTLLMWCTDAVSLLFAFAFGSCVGSLTNVLVYRLPRGIGVVTPPSSCPSCATRLTWRENIPVFGWLLLRGRCRFCGVKISPEYPVVEAVVGLLFAGLYALWYVIPGASAGHAFLGVRWGAIAPEYAINGFPQSWPAFVLLLVLVGSLVAMTIVDAKTFTIPLALAWVPAGVALVVHPLYALWLDRSAAWRSPVPGWDWIIAGPGRDDWHLIGGSIGGVVGVVVAIILLQTGLIRRSFADYDQWEASVLAERQAAAGGADPVAPTPSVSDPPVDLWVQYPHARREAIKEAIFLAPVLGLAFLGGYLGHWWGGPWTVSMETLTNVPAHTAPLWLVALTSVLMGYLVGGGVVWSVRILGALAFGKDAMGLGDVHLLAAVGACLGWVDSVIAFFLAAFVGLFWAIVSAISGGRLTRVLPFGPYLAVGTLLAVLCKPLLWALFTALTRASIQVRWP